MNGEPNSLFISDTIDRILESSSSSLQYVQSSERENMHNLLTAATNTVIAWKQRPLEFERSTVISEMTSLAYRLAGVLFDENQFDQCEKLAYLSYQLASATDWRERALGALKLALLAGSVTPKWEDLDRLRSRVRQRQRRLLGIVGAPPDRLQNGIDLSRLTDDVVWKMWERLWNMQADDDARRAVLRRNLRFGWNYTFAHSGHPALGMFRGLAREYLAGEVATRLSTGELESEWNDVFEQEQTEKFADWNVEEISDGDIENAIAEVATQLESRLQNGVERWLDWWRPLKTIRESDREAIEMFREAQQALFEGATPEGAVDAFHAAFERAPDDLGVKEWYAYACILAQDYSSAERLLEQIVTSRRQDFATITNLAGIYIRTDRPDMAAGLLAPSELFDRNLHRRPYVAAVLGLLVRLERQNELAERISKLDTIEWIAVGLHHAIRNNEADNRAKLLKRLVDSASIALGRKGSDLSDLNDALVPIAKLEHDFAYFQTEGKLEEGIEHFLARAERYPWFWANWHYLGKLAEMAGDISQAKEAFMRKAESTSASKAPRKSKQENWLYYLEFCFRNERYDGLQVGIDGALAAEVPDAKLIRYRRVISATQPAVQLATPTSTPSFAITESEGEVFISNRATSGLIGFEFDEAFAANTQWVANANPAWHGTLNVLPADRQDAGRREVAVNWLSPDGSIPSEVILRATDGSIESTMKLYRTGQAFALPERAAKLRALDLFPELTNRLRRHIAMNMPGEVLSIQSAPGFGVTAVMEGVPALASAAGYPVNTYACPSGMLNEEKISRWLMQFLTKTFPSLPVPVNLSMDTGFELIAKLKEGGVRPRQVILLTGFADEWSPATAGQPELMKLFLDAMVKLLELPDLIWITGSNDLLALRRQVDHPYWRSRQTEKLAPLTAAQIRTITGNWFEESPVLTEAALDTLVHLSGGVYDLVIALLQEAAKEANSVSQHRIYAASLLNVSGWVATHSECFSGWSKMLLPSLDTARDILDQIQQEQGIDENSMDAIYLRDQGIVVGKPGEPKLLSPLYPSRQITENFVTHPGDATATIVLVDHENLFLGLKDSANRIGREWNDRDSVFVGGIAHRLIEWVRKEHHLAAQPVAIANWDREPFISHMRPFQMNGFYTLIPDGVKANSADFLIYVECQRLLQEHPDTGTVILITGDGDFTTLIRSLKTQGKRVRAMAVNGAASLALRNAAGSDFQYIEPLLGM